MSDSATFDPQDYIGDWIDKRCPECGSQLLGNRAGDEWCNFMHCRYGLEDCSGILPTIEESEGEKT